MSSVQNLSFRVIRVIRTEKKQGGAPLLAHHPGGAYSCLLCSSFGSLLGSLGSFLGSLHSSGSQCLSSLSTLLGESSSLSLVGLYLLCKQILGSFGFLVSLLAADLTELGILLSFPSIETLLSLSLAESALLNATLQVFHQQNALT